MDEWISIAVKPTPQRIAFDRQLIVRLDSILASFGLFADSEGPVEERRCVAAMGEGEREVLLEVALKRAESCFEVGLKYKPCGVYHSVFKVLLSLKAGWLLSVIVETPVTDDVYEVDERQEFLRWNIQGLGWSLHSSLDALETSGGVEDINLLRLDGKRLFNALMDTRRARCECRGLGSWLRKSELGRSDWLGRSRDIGRNEEVLVSLPIRGERVDCTLLECLVCGGRLKFDRKGPLLRETEPIRHRLAGVCGEDELFRRFGEPDSVLPEVKRELERRGFERVAGRERGRADPFEGLIKQYAYMAVLVRFVVIFRLFDDGISTFALAAREKAWGGGFVEGVLSSWEEGRSG